MRYLTIVLILSCSSFCVAQEVSVGMSLDTVRKIFTKVPFTIGKGKQIYPVGNEQQKIKGLLAETSVRFAMTGTTSIEFDSNDIAKSLLFSKRKSNDDDFIKTKLFLENKYGEPRTITMEKDKESYAWKKGDVAMVIGKNFKDSSHKYIYYTEQVRKK